MNSFYPLLGCSKTIKLKRGKSFKMSTTNRLSNTSALAIESLMRFLMSFLSPGMSNLLASSVKVNVLFLIILRIKCFEIKFKIKLFKNFYFTGDLYRKMVIEEMPRKTLAQFESLFRTLKIYFKKC